MFDVNAFMSSTAEPMSTQMAVCPEGEYPFQMDTDGKMLQPKNLKGVSGKTGNAYDFWQLELVANCLSEEVKQKLGRQKVPVRLRINLDIDVNAGKLETGEGKNVALGRLRETLKQNQPGWSPSMLLGAGPFIGKVTHTKGSDGAVYADITRTAPIG